MFAGIREESGELYMMTNEGIIKVRGYQRKPEEEWWNQEELSGGQGTPWEPVKGREGIEVKAFLNAREEDDEVIRDLNAHAYKLRISRKMMCKQPNDG